jgi:hypothetical protein
LINSYAKDKAQYANAALQELRSQLNSADYTKTRGLNGLQFARIVNRAFSRGMPGNRAALLYFMTKHLAKHPEINQYLRDKVAKVRSVFIMPYRQEMLRFLNAGDQKTA